MERYQKILILLLHTSLFPYNSHAQLPKEEEAVLRMDPEDVSPGALEQMVATRQTLIDLNKASEEELQSLGLAGSQIDSLLAYKKTNGPLSSVYELQLVSGFDLPTLRAIKDRITVSGGERTGTSRIRRAFEDKNNYLLIRASRRYGPWAIQTAATYPGRNENLLVRFRSSVPNDFSVGFTAEKDAGEPIVWGPKQGAYGADFYSGHLSLEGLGKVRRLILGDYTYQSGEGLVFSAGLGLGKNYETILSVKQAFEGIKPYISSMESGSFRGGAATVSLTRSLELTGLFSMDRKSVKLNREDDKAFFSAINQSGLHRTETERENKDRLRELNAGGTLNFRNRSGSLELSATGLYTRFSFPMRKADHLRNMYSFSGKENIVIGQSGSFNYKNALFFYEAALSNFEGHGVLAGALISLTDKIGYSLVGRDYSPSFSSFYANALGEASSNVNERGTYTGIQAKPMRNLMVSAYMDIFAFPWLKYNVDAPSYGHEYLVFLLWKPVRGHQVRIRFREESKAVNNRGTHLSILSQLKKYNYMADLQSEASEALMFRTRIQGTVMVAEAGPVKGFLISEELIAGLGKVTLSARACLFDTYDFNTRQFIYERDVLYTFSLPSFQGRGLRTYLLGKVKLNRKADIWIKFSRTVYEEQARVNVVKEGVGENISDLKVQIKFRI